MNAPRPLPFSRGARASREPDDGTGPRHGLPRRRLPGVLPRPVDLAERIEHAGALDRATAALTGAVRGALRRRGTADLLHGVPLGQPAHPPLV